MIIGLIEMTSGEIRFEGERVQRDLIAYQQRFGYVPEEPGLYQHLTGLEHLEQDTAAISREIAGLVLA